MSILGSDASFSASPHEPEQFSKPFPFHIRAARHQDLPDLAEVLASSFHRQDGLGGWIYPLFRMGIYQDLKNRLRTVGKHYACLVAVYQPLSRQAIRAMMQAPGKEGFHTSAIAGTVELTIRTMWYPNNMRYLYVSNMAVRADYRRQGIALQLLETCDRTALDWGFHDLYLHVLEENDSARKLYQKAGYQLCRTETVPGLFMFHQSRQLLLRKRLVQTP